jgi:hypothetical protein
MPSKIISDALFLLLVEKFKGGPFFEHSLAGKDPDGWFFLTDFSNDFCDLE